MTKEEIQAGAESLGWYHTIDLGHGVLTKGQSNLHWKPHQLPPLRGRSVLDIGAWDGGYSFMAEKEGAASVTALDHYVWGIDWEARQAYWRECAQAGVLPDHHRDMTDFWRPDLPGRKGFDFARQALGSSVTPVVGDFATMDLDVLGEFDVVLYLGVLYHMEEPLTCLKRVRSATKQVAAVETVAIKVPGRESERLVEFHAGNDLGEDFGNWYVPSLSALEALCRAAGFSKVETIVGPPVDEAPAGGSSRLSRRLREAVRAAPPPTVHYRALVHAYV